MIYEEFQERIIDEVQQIEGSDGIVAVHNVMKNNGVLLHGMTIERENSKLMATLYIDNYYEQHIMGRDLGSIAAEIISIYDKAEIADVVADFFTDYTQAKYKILPKLINYEKNKEMLMDMPYRKFHDLAVVFFCLTGEKIGDGIIMVHNEHMKKWNVDVDELYDCAMDNAKMMLPVWTSSLDDTVREFTENENNDCYDDCDDYDDSGDCDNSDDYDDSDDCDDSSDCDDMYFRTGMTILSNSEKTFGACCVLYPGILDSIASKCGGNYFILPSSVHEVIILPDKAMGLKHTVPELRSIVNEVNRNAVGTQDVLSDSVYYYDKDTKKLQCD